MGAPEMTWRETLDRYKERFGNLRPTEFWRRSDEELFEDGNGAVITRPRPQKSEASGSRVLASSWPERIRIDAPASRACRRRLKFEWSGSLKLSRSIQGRMGVAGAAAHSPGGLASDIGAYWASGPYGEWAECHGQCKARRYAKLN